MQDAKALTTDARQLIADNKEPISRAIQQLDKSAAALGKLASDGSNLVANNEKKLNAVISDFKVTSENLKGDFHLRKDPHSKPLATSLPAHLGHLKTAGLAQRTANS